VLHAKFETFGGGEKKGKKKRGKQLIAEGLARRKGKNEGEKRKWLPLLRDLETGNTKKGEKKKAEGEAEKGRGGKKGKRDAAVLSMTLRLLKKKGRRKKKKGQGRRHC